MRAENSEISTAEQLSIMFEEDLKRNRDIIKKKKKALKAGKGFDKSHYPHGVPDSVVKRRLHDLTRTIGKTLRHEYLIECVSSFHDGVKRGEQFILVAGRDGSAFITCKSRRVEEADFVNKKGLFRIECWHYTFNAVIVEKLS